MRVRSRLVGTILVAAVAIPVMSVAQEPQPSRILTNGNGEVTLPPDWATMALEVTADDTSAITAAAASTDATERVLAALAALGISGDSAVRISYSVGPRYDWTEGERLVGYRARATIQLEVRELDRLARIIDRTLAAGATGVSGLRFRSDGEEDARAEALRQAVTQARADAEVLAEAVGGTLGRPLELSTERGLRPSFAFREIAGYAQTGGPVAPDLTPQDVVVLVVVEVEWELLVGSR